MHGIDLTQDADACRKTCARHRGHFEGRREYLTRPLDDLTPSTVSGSKGLWSLAIAAGGTANRGFR